MNFCAATIVFEANTGVLGQIQLYLGLIQMYIGQIQFFGGKIIVDWANTVLIMQIQLMHAKIRLYLRKYSCIYENKTVLRKTTDVFLGQYRHIWAKTVIIVVNTVVFEAYLGQIQYYI